MYGAGKGVAKDFVESAEWFRKAAVQGDSDAQYFLSGMYYDGSGVDQDFVKSAKLLTKAAAQGHVEAELKLGNLHRHGHAPGVAHDHVQAVKWYRKAADQGGAKAQEILVPCTSAAKVFHKIMLKQPGGLQRCQMGVKYAQELQFMVDLMWMCKKPDATQRCDKCKTMVYCNRTCQDADWRIHQHECNFISRTKESWNTGDDVKNSRNMAKNECILNGLKSRPEWNGQAGRIHSYDAKKARYQVTIASGKAANIKPE
jgi:TPR repeat protein